MTQFSLSNLILNCDNDTGCRRTVSILLSGVASQPWRRSVFNIGRNIFDFEWDCLIVLDTCRPDALETVSTEYDFINNVSTYWSVGSDSWEWMANTFVNDHIKKIKNTAYYTSNPNAITALKSNFDLNHNQEDIHRDKIRRLQKYGSFDLVSVVDLADYECLHREVNYNHSYPSPRALTDRAIVADREENFEKMILHYMPPHSPYIIDRQNDVITAGHGECLSSHFPRHVSGQLNPGVRRVPVVRTEAFDSKSYAPNIDEKATYSSVDEKLQSLGYK